MRQLAYTLSVALAAAAWGCGSGDPGALPSTTEAKVSGKVTVNGKPATKGKVTFELSDANPLAGAARIAEIQKDGSYEVTTLAGRNSVVVAGTGDPAADGSYNTTSVDVKSGGNTLDLRLPFDQ
jgi:hypothetical protein